jgi:hypothetical protein
MMVDDIKMDELEWSVRVSNRLKEAGIETLGQLRQWTDVELLMLPNFGRKSLNEIKEMLEWLGLGPHEQPRLSWPKVHEIKAHEINRNPFVWKTQPAPSPYDERNHAIYLARQSGRTYRSIGVEFDLSCERVCQIVQKRTRMERRIAA